MEDPVERKQILEKLFDSHLQSVISVLSLRFTVSFFHITVGNNFFANFDCAILDCGSVTIGDDVWPLPKIQIYAPLDSIDSISRKKRIESAYPAVIGDNVWIEIALFRTHTDIPCC
ncbi:MAG: hypothetical protein LBV40_04340 [Methanomicrobiales archaeon]|nr:hypothetical protein [Methanomicrobiales archaeon]